MPGGSAAEERLGNLGEFSHNDIGTKASQEPNGIGVELGIGSRVLLQGYSKKAGVQNRIGGDRQEYAHEWRRNSPNDQVMAPKVMGDCTDVPFHGVDPTAGDPSQRATEKSLNHIVIGEIDSEQDRGYDDGERQYAA
jgi:hypothetical protein